MRPPNGPLTEFERISPDEWSEGGDEADYELVDISLDQLEAAAGAGQYQEAEQARLAAYGFFEFGPELKLRAFDTQLALEIEGLIWYGANGDKGLADLVADNAPLERDPRNPPRPRRKARRRAGDHRRRRQRLHHDHQLRPDRLPRGPGGDPDPGRDHRQHARPAGTAAAADLPRRPARDPGQHADVRAGDPAARLALQIRRETGGGGRRRRDRGAAAGHELVLPPRLLDRVDQGPPRPRQGPDRGGAGDRRRRRDRRRPLHAGLHQRLPRGLRDRALPAGAAAQLRHRRRPRRRLAGPGPDRDRRRRHLRPRAQAALQEDADRDRAS